MPENAIASTIERHNRPDRRSLVGLENHWFNNDGLDRLAMTARRGQRRP